MNKLTCLRLNSLQYLIALLYFILCFYFQKACNTIFTMYYLEWSRVPSICSDLVSRPFYPIRKCCYKIANHDVVDRHAFLTMLRHGSTRYIIYTCDCFKCSRVPSLCSDLVSRPPYLIQKWCCKIANHDVVDRHAFLTMSR